MVGRSLVTSVLLLACSDGPPDVSLSRPIPMRMAAGEARVVYAVTDYESDLFYEVIPIGPTVLEQGRVPAQGALDGLAEADLEGKEVDGVGQVLEAADESGLFPVPLGLGDRIRRLRDPDVVSTPRWESYATIYNGTAEEMQVRVTAFAFDAPRPRTPGLVEITGEL